MSSSVSSKTDYLIAGKEPGANKIDGAHEHNIPLLTEKEFLGMLGGRAPADSRRQKELFCGGRTDVVARLGRPS